MKFTNVLKKIGMTCIHTIVLFSFFSLSYAYVSAVEEIAQLDKKLTTKDYDRTTGTFYGGTEAAGVGGLLSVFQISRGATELQSLSNNMNTLATREIGDIAVVGDFCKKAHCLAILPEDIPENRNLRILNLADLNQDISIPLVGPGGNPALGEIVVASNTHAFVRTVPEEDGDEGIALIRIDDECQPTFINNVRLDEMVAAVQKGAGASIESLTVNDMWWDDELERLYIALTIEVAETEVDDANNGNFNVGYAVVKGHINDEGELELSRITEAEPFANGVGSIFAFKSGFGPTVAFNKTLTNSPAGELGEVKGQYVAGVMENLTTTTAEIAITKVRTMKTSTGLHYLILNGGVISRTMKVPVRGAGMTALEEVAIEPHYQNRIWAFPLAGKGTNELQGCILKNQITKCFNECGTCKKDCDDCCKCQGDCAACCLYATPLPNDFTYSFMDQHIWKTFVVGCGNQFGLIPEEAFAADSGVPSHLPVTAIESGFIGAPSDMSEWCMVQVGHAMAPWPSDAGANDIVVLGDTVYAAFGEDADLNVEGQGKSDVHVAGIWVSQPAFNDCCKVKKWNQYERVFTSKANANLDKVGFFEVDGQTGKIIAVKVADANNPIIERTTWKQVGEHANGSLPDIVSKSLSDGVCSVLDLPSRTENILTSTFACPDDDPGPFQEVGLEGHPALCSPHSYALFGGIEKVLFTHTVGDCVKVTAPTDYANPKNSKLTTAGLEGAGAVLSLEAPTYVVGHKYFFAGTQNGLFAYAKADGSPFGAFDGCVFKALDEAPFAADDRWHRINNITGPITRIIEASNDSQKGLDLLYFVELDTQTQNGIVDKLYKVLISTNEDQSIGDNVNELTPIVIAQSGRGGLPLNACITGFEILTNQIDEGTCPASAYYGVLSTNEGIFTTTCDVCFLTQHDAHETNNEWVSVECSNDIAFNSITNPIKNNHITAKVFGTLFTNDGFNCPGIFQHSRFIQIGNDSSGLGRDAIFKQGAITPPIGPFSNRLDLIKKDNSLTREEPPAPPQNAEIVPSGLNIGPGGVKALPVCPNVCSDSRRFFTNRSAGISYVDFATRFWSDGGRRMFVRFNPDEDALSSIQSLPYDGKEWAMIGAFSDPDLADVTRVFWIESISGTGQILAGTDNGVLSLE